MWGRPCPHPCPRLCLQRRRERDGVGVVALPLLLQTRRQRPDPYPHSAPAPAPVPVPAPAPAPCPAVWPLHKTRASLLQGGRGVPRAPSISPTRRACAGPSCPPGETAASGGILSDLVGAGAATEGASASLPSLLASTASPVCSVFAAGRRCCLWRRGGEGCFAGC